MLLSDRDILTELDSGRVQLDPLSRDMIQPSSIDVRLDRFFRLFDNHKYPFIDPAEDQPELTRLIETKPAVECVSSPRRPSDDLPSSRAATSSGSDTTS